MIALQMTVVYQDGRTATVTARPVSQVAFERKYSRGFASSFSEIKDIQLEWVYFLAWHASRSGLEFDEWLDMVDTIEMGVAETVTPFDPATSAG